MGKKQSKLETIQAFNELVKDTPRATVHLLDKKHILNNDHTKGLYKAYTDAVEAFHNARATLMQTKTNFQRGLDTGLLEAGYITRSKAWSFTLDEIGNLRIREEDRSFEARSQRIATRGKAQNSHEYGEVRFDWAKEDAAASSTTGQRTSGGDTGEGTTKLSDDEVLNFLAQYERLESIDDKVSLYRNNLPNDTARVQFFEALNDKQRTALYGHISKPEKRLVYKLVKGN
jgi:hypothetical protein